MLSVKLRRFNNKHDSVSRNRAYKWIGLHSCFRAMLKYFCVRLIQARRNEIDIGGAVNNANCTGLRENFCSTTPFRLLESNLAIQIATFNGRITIYRIKTIFEMEVVNWLESMYLQSSTNITCG